MNGFIFDLKRFSVHDGDGIRTTVFFKGCPLACVWCHNPEGIPYTATDAFYQHKCIGCGECLRADFAPGNCLGGARIRYGEHISSIELLKILLEDKDFYDTTGGGVTLSGGECLMQADFCREILKLLKDNGISTAVDTSGFVSRKEFEKVIPYTDIFLYDIKAYDEDVHIRCTGASNKIIIENLRYLDEIGKETEIRIPYVPGLNNGQIPKIAHLIKELSCIVRVRVLPYHNYAESKYEALGLKSTLPKKIPQKGDIQNAKKIIKSITGLEVI